MQGTEQKKQESIEDKTKDVKQSPDISKQDKVQTKELNQMMENMEIKDQSIEEEKEEEKEGEKEEVKSISESDKASEESKYTDTKSFVQINRTEIIFGKNTLFPGSIEEIDVVIELKDYISSGQSQNSDPLMLRVIAKCNNQEFNDLDEYVYSVRSNERFQYFQEVRFKIRRKEKAQVKIAVKIPPVRQSFTTSGVLEIQLQNLTPILLPIVAKCEVPRIICVKDLYNPNQDTQLIKIPGKKNQPRMPPIPFKNMSNFTFSLEVETIAHQTFNDKPYDIVTQNFVNCPANNQFFVNLQLKENLNYKGHIPSQNIFRKILILKIKNSSVLYHFPIEVKVFEGTNQSSMS